MTPTMNEDEIARRRDHLIAEIARPEFAHNRSRILLSAAAVVIVIALATGLLVNKSDGPTQSPHLLLASADHAVQSTTDVVLHARQTLYSKNDPSKGQTQSEGWVDRSTPGVGRVVSLDAAGQPVVDSSTTVQNGQTIRKDISYDTSTVYTSPGAAVMVNPLLPSEAKSVVGDETIDGVKSIHLSGERNDAPIDTWIAEDSKLPVRVATITVNGLVVLDYQWLPRNASSLADLQAPVPSNFTAADTPIPVTQNPVAPGSDVVSINVPGQTLTSVVATLPSTTTTTSTTLAGTPPKQTTTTAVATSPTTIGASPTTTTSRPVVTTTSTSTTTTSTTAAPSLPAYSPSKHPGGGTATAGSTGQTCQDNSIAGDVVVTACVGDNADNSNASNTGVGDVRVYRLINGVKYATSDYQVVAKTITINQSNGVGGAFDCVNACTPADYASVVTGNVSHQDLKTVTVQVWMDYSVFASNNPTRPLSSFTVTTPKFEVTTSN